MYITYVFRTQIKNIIISIKPVTVDIWFYSLYRHIVTYCLSINDINLKGKLLKSFQDIYNLTRRDTVLLNTVYVYPISHFKA